MFNKILFKRFVIPLIIMAMRATGTFAATNNLRETPIVKVVRDNAKAVVNISTEQIVFLRENPYWGSYGNELDYLFGQFLSGYRPTKALKLTSVGSGVVIDKEGIIVTNAHVIHMASNIFVILNDGTSFEGKVIYENPQEDIALVKIDSAKNLKTVNLGKTDDIMTGETVVAIGNPFGLENSVSVGIISGKNREIFSTQGRPVSEGLLQTDAPINPGNSGGALLNINGELIGINVAVVENSQSIGFAIPVEKIKGAIEEHKRNEKLVIKRSAIQKENAFISPEQDREVKKTEERDPFSEMSRIRQEMDRLLQNSFTRSLPRNKGMFNSSIFYDNSFYFEDKQDSYVMKFDMKGLNKDKIDIEVTERLITISGEYSKKTNEERPEGSVEAFSYGSFLKTMPVPEDADSKKFTTNIENDTLIVTIPKKK